MRSVGWLRDAVYTSWQTSRGELAGWLAARLSWPSSFLGACRVLTHTAAGSLIAGWLITQLVLVCRVWLAGGLVL